MIRLFRRLFGGEPPSHEAVTRSSESTSPEPNEILGGRASWLKAARELEAQGQSEAAAHAYARARDVEGQVRTWAMAGDIERVDAVLTAEQERHAQDRRERRLVDEFTMAVAAGLRRDALALATAPGGAALQAPSAALDARSLRGSRVRVLLGGQPMCILLGEEVIVGRALDLPDPDAGATAPARVVVPARTVSREHVAIVRRGEAAHVQALPTENGTFIEGQRLAPGEPGRAVGAGLRLTLGRVVELRVQTSAPLAGAVTLNVGDASYVAPLRRSVTLGVLAWRLERAADDWIELVTSDESPAFMGGFEVARRVTLLRGDSFCATREGPPVLVVEDVSE